MAALKDYVVHLIGCGQMGSALIAGAVEAGVLDASKLVCIDRDEERAAALAASLGAREWSRVDTGGEPVDFEGPRLFVIAVKPQDVSTALGAFDFDTTDVVVSVAAGLSVAQLSAWCSPAQVVRTMPNTPSLIGKGVTGVYSTAACPAAEELFAAVGEVVVLSHEKNFDALTAVSGCGPAYVFLILEALADGAVLMGLDRGTARRIAAATLEGAAALALSSPHHTAELKDRVTSPGGVTIAAMAHLEERAVRGALIGAVQVAAKKSAHMGEKLS